MYCRKAYGEAGMTLEGFEWVKENFVSLKVHHANREESIYEEKIEREVSQMSLHGCD